jgi:hypothetical protein
MTIRKARKILNDNGIQWNNLFDLHFIIKNTIYEGHETIIDACKRLEHFIYFIK